METKVTAKIYKVQLMLLYGVEFLKSDQVSTANLFWQIFLHTSLVTEDA